MDAEISLIKDMNESTHLHPETEVLFVIEGHMEVMIKSRKYVLDKEHFLIISANEMHATASNEGTLIYQVLVPWKFLKRITHQEDVIFDTEDLYHQMLEETHNARKVRDVIKDLIYTYIQPEKKTRCAEESLIFKLLDLLIENYESAFLEANQKYTTDDDRVDFVLGYIRKDFTSSVSLADLAEKLYISSSTLSRLFKKQTGIYFVDYVNQMRVRHAAQRILTENESITKIAVECGFSNLSAFNKVFHKVYGMSPTEYKNTARRQKDDKLSGQQKMRDDLSVYVTENFAKKDSAYLEDTSDYQHKYLNDMSNHMITVEADVMQNQHYAKVWNKAINMGAISKMMMANIQFHTLFLKEHLNFEYVRIWDVFSKKMQISDGMQKDKFNYDEVDQVFDFLVSNRIKVILDFGRRPDVVLKAEDESIYWQDNYIEFQSRESYESLLENFIAHLIKRYGKDEIEQWVFEFSYIEDHMYPCYKSDNYDYFNVFSFGYQTIKKELPQVQVGSSGGNIQREYMYMKKFLNQCIEADQIPDFLSFHLFPYESNEHYTFKHTNNPHYEIESVHLMHELLEAMRLEKKCKIYIMEWNFTVVNRNILNDSAYRAAYIASCISKIWNQVDLLCLSIGSDWMSSYYDSTGIAYGGSGVLTKDTICKPAYFALKFLDDLGDELITKNDYAIITKKGTSYYILCYNYKNFSSNYFLKDEDAIQYADMKTVFEDNRILDIRIIMKNMPLNAIYTIKKYCISEEEGSILHEWNKFQFDTQLERSDIKYIQNACYPRIYMEKQEAVSNHLTVHAKLHPHEIMLIHVYQNE